MQPSSDDMPPTSGPLRGMTILLVEEDADAAELFELALLLNGASVTTVTSTDLALRYTERLRPQVVITRAELVEMRVGGLIGELRRRFPEVRLVALTSGPEGRAHRRPYEAAGVAKVLVRPFETKALVEAARRLKVVAPPKPEVEQVQAAAE